MKAVFVQVAFEYNKAYLKQWCNIDYSDQSDQSDQSNRSDKKWSERSGLIGALCRSALPERSTTIGALRNYRSALLERSTFVGALRTGMKHRYLC